MPNAPNRADAEEQIRKMKEASDAAKAHAAASPLAATSPAASPPAATPPPVAAPPSPVAAQSEPRARFVQTRRGRVTLAVAAIGAAALIAAAGTGGEALAIRSRYDAGCASGICDGGLYSRGHGYAIATDVLLSVGVAAAVVATIVAVVRRHERPLTVGSRF
jgi:hypothetical protein